MSFTKGDLVWAKIKGSEWPGVVTEPTPELLKKFEPKSGFICIFFFGKKSFDFVETSKIKVFNAEEKHSPKSGLKEALDDVALYLKTKDLSQFLPKSSEESSDDIVALPNKSTNSPTKRSARMLSKDVDESTSHDSEGSVDPKKRRLSCDETNNEIESTSKNDVADNVSKTENDMVINISSENDDVIEDGSASSSESEASAGSTESSGESDNESWDSLSDNEQESGTSKFDKKSSLSRAVNDEIQNSSNNKTGWIIADNIVTYSKKIGFIGIGDLAYQFVSSLKKSNHNVILWNPKIEECGKFIELGIPVTEAFDELFDLCELIFCCLPTPEELKLIVAYFMLGRKSRKNRCFIGLNGMSPPVSVHNLLALKSEEIHYLEVSCFGSPSEVENGSMILLVDGPYTSLKRCLSCLFAFSKKVMYMGEVIGKSSLTYLLTHSISAGLIVSTGELLHLKGDGTDKEHVLNILQASIMNSPTIYNKAKMMLEKSVDCHDLPLAKCITTIQDMITCANSTQPRRFPMLGMSIVLNLLKDAARLSSPSSDIACVHKINDTK